MNAALLLEHYARIADAPDAIARLRRFVLELAVRGKLVERDARDEPARELLTRIMAEKERLVRAGKARKPKAIPDLAEPPYTLPDHWYWSQIAEIGIINPRVDVDDNALASFVPMPLIAAEYGVPNSHVPRPWGQIKKGYTHFAEGDVGLAKITPCFENGKSTVFSNLTGGVGSGTTELHIVRPLFIDPAYILVFWKCPFFIENGIPRMTGTAGQKRVPMDYFANSPFPLPPLAEQHRIVAKVDELMALCDQLEAARAEREAARDTFTLSTLAKLNAPDPETFEDDASFALANLTPLTTRPDQIKQLRRMILSLAVAGKLVNQDAADAAIVPILRAIATPSAIRRKSGTGQTLSDGPFDIPESWVWGTLGQVIAFGPQNGLSPKSVTDTSAPKAITLTATTSGWFNPAHFKHVDARLEPDSDYWLQDGDLLFQRGNTREYVGMAAIYRGPPATFIYPDLMIKVRVAQSLCLPFIHLCAIAPYARAYMAEHAAGAQKTMPKINQGTLVGLPIPLPPVAEQHRIVAKVDALMTLCDQLEASITTGEQTRSRLLEAVLHDALEPA